MIDIKKFLEMMKEHEASDLYLTVDCPPSYRVNGIVRAAGNRSLTTKEVETIALSLMNDKQQNEFLETNEQNLALYYPTIGRFRVNAFRQRATAGIVIRRIKNQIPSIDELKLPPILKEIAMTKRGLVLVVGSTGSGKSTTLASMIDYRNQTQAGHIISIEDPIEYIHEHKKSIITQREVGVDTESYHVALKNALRQAPDVILIGEIRDLETMEAALTFAETGHLCLATLHANNADQAMERIMNFFPLERHKQIYMQLSMNLRANISQRLIPTLKKGSRVAAVEILLGTPRVKDLIHKGETTSIKEAMEKSSVVGMQTFDKHLYELYKRNEISLDEALKNADSQNNLRLRIKLEEDGKPGAHKKKTGDDPFDTFEDLTLQSE
jgi:twitching motility protein PilU